MRCPLPFEARRLVLGFGLAALVSCSARAEVLARAWVPNGVLPQGEVRLVEQDGEAVVQSVLHTRFEGRVQGKIVGSERENWGEHADANAYLASLKDAFQEYTRRKSASKVPVALVIDFAAGPETSRIDFSFPRVIREEEGLRIESTDVWKTLSPSRDYVVKNQELILADALGDHAEQAIRRLRSVRSQELVDE